MPARKHEGELDCIAGTDRNVKLTVEVDLAGGDGALASDERSVDHAREGQHGKTAVLELRELVPGESSRVLAKTKGIELEVTGLAAVFEHGVARHFEAVGEEFHHAAEHKDLKQTASGHLEEGFGRYGIGGGFEGQADEFLHDAAKGGKHANAAVLQFCLAQPVQGVLCREAEGVEANIASH